MLRLLRRRQEGAAAGSGSGVPEFVRLSDHGDSVSIGRNPSCQLRLSSPAAPALLSRKHAVVERRDEGLYVLEDQQSFNGCFVNNMRVSSPTVLNHGDTISFGPQVLMNTEGGEFPNPFIYRFEADAADQRMRRASTPQIASELAGASGNRIQRPGKATVDGRGNSSSCRAVDLVVDLTDDDAEVLGPAAAAALAQTVDLTAEPPASPHPAQPGPSSTRREQHARPGLQQATLLDLDKTSARRKRFHAEAVIALSSPKRQRQQDAAVPAPASEQNKDDNGAMELLGEEFECVICREWLIAAHTLSCSHTFCGDCITSWLSKNDTCPTCRERIAGPPVAVRTIDNVIDRMAAKHMTEEERTERDRRKKAFEQMKKRQPSRSRHHHARMGAEMPFGHYPPHHLIHMSEVRAPSPSHVLRMLQHLPLSLFPSPERHHAVSPPRVHRRPQNGAVAGGAGSSRRCTYTVEYARNGRIPCHTCHAPIQARQPFFTVAPEGHPFTHHHIHCLQLQGGVSLRSINGLRNLSISDQARVREAVELIV